MSAIKVEVLVHNQCIKSLNICMIITPNAYYYKLFAKIYYLCYVLKQDQKNSKAIFLY